MLLIFGGLGHDDDDHEHDNLTPVDSTPVNGGEDYFIIPFICTCHIKFDYVRNKSTINTDCS